MCVCIYIQRRGGGLCLLEPSLMNSASSRKQVFLAAAAAHLPLSPQMHRCSSSSSRLSSRQQTSEQGRVCGEKGPGSLMACACCNNRSSLKSGIYMKPARRDDERRRSVRSFFFFSYFQPKNKINAALHVVAAETICRRRVRIYGRRYTLPAATRQMLGVAFFLPSFGPLRRKKYAFF